MKLADKIIKNFNESKIVEQADFYITDVEFESYGEPKELLDKIAPENISPVYRQTVKLKWDIDIQGRNSGIEGISLIVPKQELEVKFEESTDDGDIVHFVKIIIEDPKITIEPSDEVKFLSIYPQEVKYDFKKNKSEIIFGIS